LSDCAVCSAWGGISDGAMGPPLVGGHSKSRSTPEAARLAVKIAFAFKWFHARREVGDLPEEPRRGGPGDENVRQVSVCRHGGAARRYGTARRIPRGGRDG
jgi:hypothetical protein